MRFNAKKCYILSTRNKSHKIYSLNEHILQQVKHNPYLGLQISKDLKMDHPHIKPGKESEFNTRLSKKKLEILPTRLQKKNPAYISLVDQRWNMEPT